MFSKKINKSFSLKDIDAGHHKVTYKGITAIKCPFDYVLYQMIVFEIKPDLIIEIGTNAGGAALYLADMLEINKKGELHTIDLPENKENELLHTHPRIKVFKKGFQGYDVSLLTNFKTIMVIDDGSHIYGDVKEALAKFSPFISPGSYFIVEDGIITELGLEKEYNGGPKKAIREFLKENSHFTIDETWCNFFGHNATFNINGYIKRIA
jgi:cephalosporin hydroxylase